MDTIIRKLKKKKKTVIRKFWKIKLNSPFIDNICGSTDLVDMQLIRKFNKRIGFVLCVIDIFSKYTWAIPLKDKKRCYHYQCFSKEFQKI